MLFISVHSLSEMGCCSSCFFKIALCCDMPASESESLAFDLQWNVFTYVHLKFWTFDHGRLTPQQYENDRTSPHNLVLSLIIQHSLWVFSFQSCRIVFLKYISYITEFIQCIDLINQFSRFVSMQGLLIGIFLKMYSGILLSPNLRPECFCF